MGIDGIAKVSMSCFWGCEDDLECSTGIVRFGNNQIAKIMGYGDYQMGTVTISQLQRPCLGYDIEGKRKKHTHKPKVEDSIQEKLYLLHMDLYKPMSSGLVQKPPFTKPCVPPTKSDWDILFQPMFDEYFNPPLSVASPVPAVVASEPVDPTGTSSSTSINQDTPSPSTSQTHQESQSLIIPSGVEEQFHDIKVAHLDNDPFFGVSISKPNSKESSSRDVIPTNVHSVNQPSKRLRKWTKDHPLDNVIGNPSRPYDMESCDPVDTPMVEKSKLDTDPQGKEVDPTYYHGMIGSDEYLITYKVREREGFAAILVVLITEASKSRQHGGRLPAPERIALSARVVIEKFVC
uniref:Integrase, catalytic region, zinc finger, CCHC-type, peptidase aspartic, catalytic n=1 Tax=Tanacetum cinerariifolium TaxID=118510 RepID=A0A699HFS2_TANCI|nr:hypothetical protein [Tanacetum cinerariifolium]